jgi:hypothetical protein
VKNVIEDVDAHLVIHDAASVALAGVLGVAGALATGSPGVGVVAAGLVATTGICSMRIGPLRRGVNSVAISLTEDRAKESPEERVEV